MTNSPVTNSLKTPSELPFELDEYLVRQQRVRAAMQRREIDVLYIASPANILYLTGYETGWYPPHLPLGVAIARDPDALVFFDWTLHEHSQRFNALLDDVVFFDGDKVEPAMLKAFQKRGWTRRTVALECQTPNPAVPAINAMADFLYDAGARLVSGDWIVDGVRLYKSEAELARIRRAGLIADTAFNRLQTDLKPGMTELEVSAHLSALLISLGSDYVAAQPLISSGPTAWCDLHALPSQRRLQAGDIVAIDCCAAVDRYHANLSRTFALGDVSSRATEILAMAASSLSVLQAQARLGDGLDIAANAAGSHVRLCIPEDRIRWVGGYALGLAFAPHWSGHTCLNNSGPECWSWKENYVSSFETVFYDREEGFKAQCKDTVVMTARGLESLSSLPRTLLPVEI
ncbi:MAG: Xaa-Pro peptidase family protein [Exilibacterium sp.]